MTMTDRAADRAAWMQQARWGLFLHFLPAPPGSAAGADLGAEEWNRRVDAFDVAGLAAQAAAVGAGWVGLTIGQNTGHYCAPNPVYDAITGIRPSRCARRDLIADLHAALAPHGIRLLAYLPSGAPEHDRAAVAALGWSGGGRDAAFQRRWEAVIRQWSEAWGRRVDAWWFDGCYRPDAMYRQAEEPNFTSFAAAARAGNPQAAVAWNPGVAHPPRSLDPREDYTAGEVNDPDACDAAGASVDGVQAHLLTYLGQTWGTGPLRFSPERAARTTRHFTDHGGAVTWDVPLRGDGLVEPEALAALAAVGAAVNPTRGHPVRPPIPVPRLRLAFLRSPEAGRPGCARLELANPHPHAVQGAVRLHAGHPACVDGGGMREIAYHLPPGATGSWEVPVTLAAADPRAEIVVERCADGRLIPVPVPVRRILDLPVLPDAGDRLAGGLAAIPARCLADAGGRTLGELRLARRSGALAVSLRAFEPHPVQTARLWDGSCLELFAARPGQAPRQLLIAPAAQGLPLRAARVVDQGRHQAPALVPVPWLMAEGVAAPGGWGLHLLVPLAPWLDDAGDAAGLLLDVVLDAGGRAALSGDLGAARDSAAYLHCP